MFHPRPIKIESLGMGLGISTLKNQFSELEWTSPSPSTHVEAGMGKWHVFSLRIF